MIDTDGKFYLGKIVEPASGERTNEKLLYDPDDLTTHAVVVGMTGSGKTGLCLDLLEEAALQEIPALMIDPKGDITNMLLHFPELLASDFEPWVNPDEARRDGKSVGQLAQETADLWRNGLSGWDIEPDRIQALKDGPRFSVYTPGSDAGYQVSILASLAVPNISWEGNAELLREKISGTVTAVLGLAGFKDIDPVRSREHILLANIFEQSWQKGQDLTLEELIMQTQSPPFEKLGVFDVNRFFPEKDRFGLAMQLNNILASPAFQTWIEGESLDVGKLLYEEDGSPRHTIFYIAHLPEAERMFFVTLLYSAVETWMRAQSGTTSLRALVYFDEIFGYLPPIGNPPSKEPMLRMLKQARAFGVGLVLATQNPVDIDYKALSNAGTWFVGKLGTEQDKARLLDGLQSIAGDMDRGQYDDLISALGKRVFLLRNVHDKKPSLFQTRWAMNYLAGPVTRGQIGTLNALEESAPAQGNAPTTTQPVAAAKTRPQTAVINNGSQTTADEPKLPGSQTAPAIPRGVGEYFLPDMLTLRAAAEKDGRSLAGDAKELGLLYRPVLLAQAQVRFVQRKYDLRTEQETTALLHEPDDRGMVRWEEYLVEGISERELLRRGVGNGRYASLEGPLADGKLTKSLEKDFIDWIYREQTVAIKANETLKVYASPEMSEAAFLQQCAEAAAEKVEVEATKVEAKFAKQIDRLRDKLSDEERELREDEAELSQRKREEMATHAETFFKFFSSRRKSVSSSMTKRRMTEKAKADVEESIEEIADLKKQIEETRKAQEEALEEINERWADIAEEISEIPVSPYKKDIGLSLFGVAWLPHYMVQSNGQLLEIPAFVTG